MVEEREKVQGRPGGFTSASGWFVPSIRLRKFLSSISSQRVPPVCVERESVCGKSVRYRSSSVACETVSFVHTLYRPSIAQSLFSVRLVQLSFRAQANQIIGCVV